MPPSGAARVEAVSAKRGQILAGARQVFGELGFERASVDVIAARAGVSKATIYNHYQDKHALFVACATEEVEELRAGLAACLAEPPGEVEDALQAIGERAMALFLSPAVVNLYRHVIAEAPRFPEMSQALFDRGLSAICDAVADHLARWARHGALRIDDPRGAAVQFVALCQGDLVARARLGILAYPVDGPMRATVRGAVRTFLRAYR
jgi:TetR/AcrR family transcriptional regulator, mexJK operon transcriptional repressor